MATGWSWRSAPQIALSIGAPLCLLAALAWPLLFANATFNEDWLNHLWYMWHQSLAIRDNHAPSLFLNYSHGVFYPLYAFYGGTIYALTGALSLALGNAPLDAYVLTYLLGFIAAYAGWYWTSRIAGLSRSLAHAPGIVFVTSASYLTIIYGLGDWPEFLGVSIMPLMIASGLDVIRAKQLRFLPAAALVGSSIIFFGSHLLTVIWGSTILIVFGLAILALVPEARGRIGWVNILRVASLMIPAFLVSAWFLLPTAAYESKTVIAQSYPYFRLRLQQTMYLVAVRHLFTLSRAQISDTVLRTSLPILIIAWVFAGIGISWRTRRNGPWMKTLFVISAATALLLVVMTHAVIILALPRIYATLQFSFRLESYVLLGISGAVLAVLAANRDGGPGSRFWTWTLVPILAVSVIGAAQQTDAYPSGQSRSVALSSYLEPIYEQEGLTNYVYDPVNVISAHLLQVTFPPGSVHHDHASLLIHATPGQRVDTNIRSRSEFVHISGARIVGTDQDANDVLEIAPRSGVASRAGTHHGNATPPEVRISVTSADSLAIVAGRLLTWLALAVLACEFLLLAVIGRRRAP